MATVLTCSRSQHRGIVRGEIPEGLQGPQGMARMERRRFRNLRDPVDSLEKGTTRLWYESRESHERGNLETGYGET